MIKSVVVFSAHPDDAETCCGGTICRLTGEGHAVHIVNLTCSAPIRASEARDSAAVMGASVETWDFPDGSLLVNEESLARVQATIEKLKPHLILAHWPVDFHQDHQTVGSLVLQAMNRLEGKMDPQPELHYYEACLGYQSLYFHPNHYVDITPFLARKRAAVECNVSVNAIEVYPIHESMQKTRGYECGVSYAEGFIRLPFRLGSTRDAVVGEGTELPS